VRVVRTENVGLAAARNLGAGHLEEEALLFLDADDRVCPSFIEECLNVLSNSHDAGAVGSWTRYFEERNGSFCPPPMHFPLQLYTNLSSCIALIRREAFLQLDGYSACLSEGLEDFDFWIRLLAQDWRFVTIPELLHEYRVRDQSMLHSMSQSKLNWLFESIASKNAECFSEHMHEVMMLARTNGSGDSGAHMSANELRILKTYRSIRGAIESVTGQIVERPSL
jgi:glycosyltransferase involved in cell wall biosynthesis